MLSASSYSVEDLRGYYDRIGDLMLSQMSVSRVRALGAYVYSANAGGMNTTSRIKCLWGVRQDVQHTTHPVGRQ